MRLQRSVSIHRLLLIHRAAFKSCLSEGGFQKTWPPKSTHRLRNLWVLDVQLDFPHPSRTVCPELTDLNSPLGPHLFPSCHLVCLSLSLPLSLFFLKFYFPF